MSYQRGDVVWGPNPFKSSENPRPWLILILPDVTMLLRMMLRLGFSVVSDAERYPGCNGITSGSMTSRKAATA